VATSSAHQGEQITVQSSGEADNLGFGFIAGQAVFLGIGGSLLQNTASGSAFQQQIGMALSLSRLLITLGEAILYP
jgi:hypothetical protein